MILTRRPVYYRPVPFEWQAGISPRDQLCIVRHRDGGLSMTHGRQEYIEHWPWWLRWIGWLPLRSKIQYLAWPDRQGLLVLNLSNLAQLIWVGGRPITLRPYQSRFVAGRRRTVVRYTGRVNWYVVGLGSVGPSIQHIK